MKTLILYITLTFCSISFAGTGHSHGGEQGHSHGAPTINASNAQETGQLHVDRLIKTKKIDASWAEASFDKAEEKSFNNKVEWVVTFNNEKGVKGKKLYIFLKPSGEFVAANFTGK